MSEDKPREKPDPADEVLAIIVYKNDPYCVSYRFEVRGEYGHDDPRHLEQLKIIEDLVAKYIAASEEAVIKDTVMASRKTRRASLEYMENLKVKPEEVN